MTGQLSLFESGTGATAVRFDLQDAEVELLPEFLSVSFSDRLFAELGETVAWKQESIVMYGKPMPVPRLSAWYGEMENVYTYSGISMAPLAWTPLLREIKSAIEEESNLGFNCVLINLYRNGRDSVSWHSDDEPELGENPVIASLSLGQTRKFQLRNKLRHDLKEEIELTHGSLLVMSGSTQECWQHQVPKTSRGIGPRINLTFRNTYWD
ncbi:MAG: alpha-ketoglutarate-dependent dioxygenase AlkB family protein [Acidimicrobiales bacterium]